MNIINKKLLRSPKAPSKSANDVHLHSSLVFLKLKRLRFFASCGKKISSPNDTKLKKENSGGWNDHLDGGAPS